MTFWRLRKKTDRRALLEDIASNQRLALVRYVDTIVCDGALANDIVQEALIRLWEADHVVGPLHARRWVYRTARNLALDRVLQSARRAELLHLDPHRFAPQSPSADPEDAATMSRLREAFFRALEDLPPRQQEVVRLRLEGGLSYRDVAEVMETTTSNVGVLLHNAVKRLQKALARSGVTTDPNQKAVGS